MLDRQFYRCIIILAMFLSAWKFQLFLGRPSNTHETNPNWFKLCMKDQYCQNQMIIRYYFYGLLKLRFWNNVCLFDLFCCWNFNNKQRIHHMIMTNSTKIRSRCENSCSKRLWEQGPKCKSQQQKPGGVVEFHQSKQRSKWSWSDSQRQRWDQQPVASTF